MTIYQLSRSQGKTGVSALVETERVCKLSSKTIRTYVRFSYLIPEILDAVELGIVKKSVAYELSFLNSVKQQEYCKKLLSGEKITASAVREVRLSKL